MNGLYRALILLSISININAQSLPKENSVLSSGKWFKIAVTQNGIYSISPQDLINLGYSQTPIPFSSISIFGNGGRMLPEKAGSEIFDDLEIIRIQIKDADANQFFNGNDRIFFFAKASDHWFYNSACGQMVMENNAYSDSAYYFIRIQDGLQSPALINRPSLSNQPSVTVTDFNDLISIEKDSLNLTQSGRMWFWKQFEFINTYNFSLNIPGIITTKPSFIRSRVAGRCIGLVGNIDLRINGTQVLNLSPMPVGSSYEDDIASLDMKCGSFTPSGQQLLISLSRINDNCDRAWLDFIELNLTRSLAKYGGQTSFRNISTINQNVVEYQVQNAGGSAIWDVTNHLSPVNQLHSGGNFRCFGDSLREFVVFDEDGAFTPFLIGSVDNQNLHGLPFADVLIVTSPDFLAQANRLAEFHRQQDQLLVHVVTTNQIYNEFSSGSQDVTAIRNFVRMFYRRFKAGLMKMPPYLLLFGDASYDYKTYLNRTYRDSSGTRININTNFVPTYQSVNSVSRSGGSFAADEYYALVSDSAGLVSGISFQTGVDKQTIGVGRLFPDNTKEADDIVNKIIHYVTSPDCKNDWRNIITFVADDMDNSWEQGFFDGSESLASLMKNSFPVWNVDKIYEDAYKQEISSGQRYPDAQKALFDRINKGTLLVNYIGHGGEAGWTNERLLTFADIEGWKNYDRLPAFLTATCTFTRFDNPNVFSAGEYIQVKPDGGGIALFSTVRPIGLVPGFNQPIYNAAFTIDSSKNYPRLGDLIRRAKNSYNNGSFPIMHLFGDPAMRLSYPTNNVVVDEVINQFNAITDTIRATDLITIKGHIENRSQQLLADFNGILYPTVFDKPSNHKTLANDAAAKVFNFTIQNNILFKGRAEVKNGLFEFSFKVPRDINYQFGEGKISLYASDESTDGQGHKYITVGGSSGNCSALNEGPAIDIFMNDQYFQSGGITNSDPVIFARVSDQDGINTTGAGIGHDIIATLTGPVTIEYNLNEYYTAETGSYTNGEISYPLRDLPDGLYTLTLKVWDVCNNSSTKSLQFRVNGSGFVVENLYNYPNPFNGSTTFSFQHNLAGSNLDVSLNIYDMQGRLCHAINRTVNSDGFNNVEIKWDGASGGLAPMPTGMYFYTIFVKNPEGKEARASAKLIVMN